MTIVRGETHEEAQEIIDSLVAQRAIALKALGNICEKTLNTTVYNEVKLALAKIEALTDLLEERYS